ncbi:hypothetical protein G7046_g1286 [Stylonectria norvegica]|nr:hypothetical protein G7046_g1286 [Stylonectria norvegica]
MEISDDIADTCRVRVPSANGLLQPHGAASTTNLGVVDNTSNRAVGDGVDGVEPVVTAVTAFTRPSGVSHKPPSRPSGVARPELLGNVVHLPAWMGDVEEDAQDDLPLEPSSILTPLSPSTVPKPATSSASILAKSNPNQSLAYQSDSESDAQARGGRRTTKRQLVLPLPTSTGLSQPAGQLLRGATDDEGKLKTAALLVGIKLDLEAEVHLTARVKGDIVVGLY